MLRRRRFRNQARLLHRRQSSRAIVMPRVSVPALVFTLTITIAAQSNMPSVAFVARWGGATKDIASAIAIDAQGVYVAGSTYSADFPVTTGVKTTGNWCVFATKLRAESGAVAYSTA